jgi:osmotically-inducible protein OsmY
LRAAAPLGNNSYSQYLEIARKLSNPAKLSCGRSRAIGERMKSHFTSQIALASQLFAASAGLYLAAPSLLTAQTPAIQKMSKADRELTQKIRKAVVADKSLSLEAHNVHIGAQDGAVTLTGTVKSEDEKKAVEDKANEIAGTGKVTNELSVSDK